MSKLSKQERNLGKWSAFATAFFILAYVATGLVWLFTNIRSAQTRFLEPSEPCLTILELIMFLTAPTLVILMAVLYKYAP